MIASVDSTGASPPFCQTLICRYTFAADWRFLSGLCLKHGVLGSYFPSWARSLGTALQFCQSAKKFPSAESSDTRLQGPSRIAVRLEAPCHHPVLRIPLTLAILLWYNYSVRIAERRLRDRLLRIAPRFKTSPDTTRTINPGRKNT